MLAERLVDFARQATPGSEAREMMRLSLFDWAACAIAGAGTEVAAILRAQALEEAGRGEASLIGGGRAPARMAALVNGTVSHALDYDDTHFAHIGHTSVAVVPAALAMAERTGASGRALLDAAVIGAEGAVRFGLWLGRGHYQAGFHQTATAGAFGAALAALRLLGLGAEQGGHALGLAASRASGLKAQFGAMGKPLNAGIAAANGVEAALLAARGLSSHAAALDGPQGFGATHHGAGEPAALDELGARWLIEANTHKFHACCHGLHAALEALGEALGDTSAGAVETVEVTAHPRWESVCNIAEPSTGLEAKFSFRQVVALRLAGHDTAALDSFSDRLARDETLARLRARVRVGFDPALGETEARVGLRLSGRGNDGGRRQASHDLARPMTAAMREARLRAKAEALLGAERAGALWQAVGDADTGPDIAAFRAALAGPGAV